MNIINIYDNDDNYIASAATYKAAFKYLMNDPNKINEDMEMSFPEGFEYPYTIGKVKDCLGVNWQYKMMKWPIEQAMAFWNENGINFVVYKLYE